MHTVGNRHADFVACAVCAAGVPAGALPGGLWAVEGPAAPAAVMRGRPGALAQRLLRGGAQRCACSAQPLPGQQQVPLSSHARCLLSLYQGMQDVGAA